MLEMNEPNWNWQKNAFWAFISGTCGTEKFQKITLVIMTRNYHLFLRWSSHALTKKNESRINSWKFGNIQNIQNLSPKLLHPVHGIDKMSTFHIFWIYRLNVFTGSKYTFQGHCK